VFFQPASRILMLALLASSQFHALDVAFKSNRDAQQNGAAFRSTAGCAMQMQTDTEGVDFNSYLRDVYVSVKTRWFANMPPSLEKGQQGKNTVEFRVLRDGSVPKDSLKVMLSSDKSDFDAASLQGVKEAAPFNHLPVAFSKPDIVLRVTFYYNLPIPRNPG
jgi:TonB family protein